MALSKQINLDAIPDRSWIKRKYDRIQHRITKLFQFIKLGWNDNDWDYGYTYDILKYKLECQLDTFNNSPIHMENTFSAKVCRVALKALDKFHYDKFEYHSNYAEKNLPFKYKMSFVPSPDIQGCSRMVWVYEDSEQPLALVDLELKNKVGREAIALEQRMHKKYKDLFYNLLNKHMDTLWD